jgi:lactate permease
MNLPWHQQYDPFHNVLLSTLVAAVPVVLLLTSIAILRIRIHFSALLGLGCALAVALWAYRMPAGLAGASAVYGVLFGLFPIGWVVLHVIFFYQLTVKRGLFDILRESLAALAPDPRIQVILIAFAFGAFIEGVAGFGAPVAITGAILIQLGFKPLHAAGLSLIANTAPVAFGTMGIPITTLEQVTGIDALQLSKMVGRQLPFFSALVPAWIVMAYSGWRGLRGVWPAAAVAGLCFAVPQFLVSNFHGPWLVDTISGGCSIVGMVVLLRFWQPKPQPGATLTAQSVQSATDHHVSRSSATGPGHSASDGSGHTNPSAVATLAGDSAVVELSSPHPSFTKAQLIRCWAPWVVLTASILLWGLPPMKASLDKLAAPSINVLHLHQAVQRVPPVAPVDAKPEAALFRFNFLSATGSAIFLAAIIVGLAMGFGPRELARTYLQTIWRIRYSLLTIAAMLALGNVTRYSGADATLGLAMARTGVLYPFFGTLLGWLGVALTGSDTASNVLFGSLQKITAEQTGLSPILMTAANSTGGVMGKMIDAQSIVVASTVTNWYGHEGTLLRYVFFHSLALAALMGLWVFGQAYCWPLTQLVVR